MLSRRRKTMETTEQSVPLISSSKQGMAGFIAGFTATAFTYPLDLVKTRFQSSHYSHYRSSVNAFNSIIKSNGMRGLIVGIEASIIGSSVAWGSYFYLYSAIKNQFRLSPNSQLTPSQHLLSSFCAGGITQIITNPIWVIKTNLQLNQSTKIVENINNIYTNRGLIGFWRGILPSMFGVCQASIHFMVYEHIKYVLQEKHNRFMTPLEIISNTIFAKSIAVMITYPYQVMRTRLQHIDGEHQKILPLMQTIYKQNGIKGFYKGISINITRIMPATCITFLVYETLKTRL